MNKNYVNFMYISIITAFSTTIAIVFNKYLENARTKCSSNSEESILCKKFLNISLQDWKIPLDVFFITFISSFISYLIFYEFFGYK